MLVRMGIHALSVFGVTLAHIYYSQLLNATRFMAHIVRAYSFLARCLRFCAALQFVITYS